MITCDGHCWVFFFQAEDGIRDLVRSRGLGDVYKRQGIFQIHCQLPQKLFNQINFPYFLIINFIKGIYSICLLYTSDAADERSSVDLGGRRIIKKKKQLSICGSLTLYRKTVNVEKYNSQRRIKNRKKDMYK